jgi:hypothetical protein
MTAIRHENESNRRESRRLYSLDRTFLELKNRQELVQYASMVA